MYQWLMGRLIYPTHNWILHSVSMDTQFVYNPKEVYLQAGHQVLQYLNARKRHFIQEKWRCGT